MITIYKNFFRILLGIFFILCGSLSRAQKSPVQAHSFQVKPGSVTPGRVLIKLKPAGNMVVGRRISQLSKNISTASFNTGIMRLDAVARNFKATNMVRAIPNAGRMEAKQRKYGLDRWYILNVDKGSDITAAVNSFRAVAEVESAQPAYVIKSITAPITKITGSLKKPLDASSDTPPVNDPYYWVQWHYHNTGQMGGYAGADIDLEPAWKINAGKPNVIVDVVDEGVDFKHEDLAANMWVNLAELNGQPGVDDDGNGYIDDIHGFNFGDNSSNILPGDHGTHTSGTIAAVNNNGKGVCGIAGGTGVGDGARIMSSEIFGTNGADGAGTAAAIIYGANNGAVISQNSWGYTTPGVYDQLVLDAIDYFTKEAGRDVNGNQVGPMNGGVVIFAAGNDNINDLCYPGYYPTAIAVGATTCFDNKAAYSNFGDWVDIAAPGGGDAADGTSHQMVASTVANNSYGYMEGTSMATPHVSGVAALIVSQFGKMGFTTDDLKNRLFHSVRQWIAMDPSYNGLMGVGALDAGKALQTDKGIPPTVISDLKGISNAQNSIDINWTAPADQDNTNAESYIVYYSKSPFDSAHRDTVNKIIIKKALSAGSHEIFNILGLFPSTSYHISVSAKDLWANESSLSNQVIVKTQDGPIVNLPTDTILMNINVTTSPAKSTSFKLTNNGTGVMNWTGTAIPVSSTWARTDGYDTMKLVDQDYASWFIGDDARQNFSAATRFDVTKKPFNLTHVANYFQTSGVTAPITIFIYKGGSDPSQGTLLLKQTLGSATDYSLNVTKLNGMFLFQPGEWYWIVYQFDPLYGFAQGAEYDGPAELEHYFLASSDKGKTWGTLNSLLGYPVRLFMLGLSNEGYPGGFVSMVPSSGNLAGLANTTVGVNANATTIRNGVYNYNLQVASNDLNNPMPGVPMIVTVTGQKGTLTSKIGILDAGSVFLGKSGDATITLYNAGLSTLKNFAYTSNNTKFTLTSMPDSLNPGDSAKLTITFTPTAAGQQLAKIKITTNDGSLDLSGSGVGVRPPVMDLTGVPVQIVAKVDSIGKNTFTISNKNGKYPLSYSMPEIAAINKLALKKKTAKGTDPSMDYAWIDSNEPDGPVYSWDDISKTGTEITKKLAADIKTSMLAPLGFRMKFYGDTISEVYVNNFGSLSLNYPGAMNIVTNQMPIPGDGITGLIGGCFVEYMTPAVNTNGHVYVKNLPGKFIVQYNDLEYFGGNEFGGSFSYGKATFQIVLYSNGKIEMNYKTVNDTWASQGFGIVGLESKDETKGINIATSPDFIQPAPFMPADNTTLWWVPSAPKFIRSIFPTSGAVAAGDTVNITVTASAVGLVDSTYNTAIALTTNDPLQEKVDVPVVFTVTGIQGMMQKTDTLAFGNVYKNGISKMDAVFLNTGTKPVNLISTSFNSAAYTTDQGPVIVPPLSELHIPVSFAPTAETAYPGTLTVTTDDSAKAVFTVILTGAGKAAGALSYELTGGQVNTLNIGQILPANLKVTNNGDGDLKIMVEHPQWFLMNQSGQGVGNGLDSANTYSLHKSMDSSSAAYEWFELGHGLGTPSVVSPGGVSSQPIKLPFAFPYYGKTYQTLYTDWNGNVTVDPEKPVLQISPTLPTTLTPNGIIATVNYPLSHGYDWEKGVYVGETYYYTDSEKLVIEYYNMFGGNYFDGGNVTFETIFYKDGRIKMMYQAGETTSNFTQNFMVGIQNQDGTDGTLAYNQTLWYKDHGAIEYVPSIPYTLKPGESVDLPASWTTTSMTNGVYKDYLTIISNDPLQSSIHIPMELEVNGNNSVKTTDTVKFGKVVSYTDQNSVQNTYNQPVLIKNDGKQTITINNIDFSNNTAFTLDEVTNYQVQFPIVLAPGEELRYHITFTPIPSMNQVNEFVNVSSDYPTAISIPISALVIQPPVVNTDSPSIHITIQQTDSAVRYVQLGNTGLGDLDYTLGIEYHRPGISYNNVKPAQPLKNTPKKSNVFTLFGGGQKTQILGTNGTVLGNPPGGFADSILAYETGPGSHNIDFLGTGVDEAPLMAVSRFNGGKKGFYLSHVGNVYRTDNMIASTIKFRIRLGSNVNTSTVIYEQSVDIQPDTSGVGTHIIVPLDSSILINAYEDFWIEWDYAYGMRFPQGFQFVSADQQRMQSYYTKVNEADAFQEMYLIADFYMAAYAQTDSAGGWLMLTPDKGTNAVNETTQLTLTAHGPKATPPDQSADLIIHSNDPVNPVTKVMVFLHIDQAPTLTNHDTLIVNEADTLNALIPASDDGGGIVTVKLVNPDTAASIIIGTDGNYFNYRPGYNDSGVHVFAITLTDDIGNSRNESLVVLVKNTNRAPIVVNHLADRIVSIKSAAIRVAMDTVFMDPDGDTLKYRFAGPVNTIVKVYVDSTGETSIIPIDTGRIDLVFEARDIYEAAAWDTLHLIVRQNAAPVVTNIPNIIIEKGMNRTLELSHYFSDPDDQDVLTYSDILDSISVVNGLSVLSLNGSELNIEGLNAGNGIITVTADDGFGGTVSKSFGLIVLNNKGNIVDDYKITVGPNPVHNTANIKFELGTEKQVRIDLFTMDGKLQSQLFEGSRAAGYQSLQINLSNVADGNYLLKFTIDGKEGVIQIAKL